MLITLLVIVIMEIGVNMIRVAYYEIDVLRDTNQGEKCRIAVFRTGRLVKTIEAKDRNEAKQRLIEMIEQMLSEIYD